MIYTNNIVKFTYKIAPDAQAWILSLSDEDLQRYLDGELKRP